MAADRKLFVALGVNDRRLGAGLKRGEKKFERFGSRVSKKLNSAFSKIKLAGAGAFALAARDVFTFEDSLNRIEIQAGMTGRETDELRNSMVALSNDTGIARTEIVKSATALINLTGDIDFTADSLEVLADAQLATGSGMDDLAGLAFSLNKSFKLKGPEELERGLSAIIEAGKRGAIPLGEMTVVLQQLSAKFAELGVVGVDGAASLASALQVLRPGFGSAAEAGTGLSGLLTALKKKSDKLKKHGIITHVVDENGVQQARDLGLVLDDFAKSDLAKSKTGLIKIMGRTEGALALQMLASNREEYDKLVAAAKKSNAIQTDSDKRRQSSAFKLKKAWNDIKEAIAKAITPERIEKFVEAIEALAHAIGGIISNLKTAVKLYAVFKAAQFANNMGAIGGIAGLAGKSGIGAAINGASGLGKLGLVGAAAAAGVALGTFADRALGLSDGLSSMAFDMFGSFGDVAGNRSRTKSALGSQLASGDITQEKHDRDLAKRRETFAFRGRNELLASIGTKTRDKTGSTIESQRKRIGDMSDTEKKQLTQLAQQALVASARGEDTSGLVDKIATAINGAKINVKFSDKMLTNILDNASGQGVSP